jgi:hypothetical protein
MARDTLIYRRGIEIAVNMRVLYVECRGPFERNARRLPWKRTFSLPLSLFIVEAL